MKESKKEKSGKKLLNMRLKDIKKKKMKKKSKKKEKRPWWDLHQTLLEPILKRLYLPEYLKFGTICSSWRMAVKQRLHSPAPQLPWLMLRRNLNHRKREYYSLSFDKIYKKKTCEIRHRRCRSSSQGWLLTQHTQEESCSPVLINPFTNKSIRLPKKNGNDLLECLFFSTPTDPDGVLIIRKPSCKSFMFFRLKGHQWNKEELKGHELNKHEFKENVYSNVISCNGKLYGLNQRKALLVIDNLLSSPTNMRLKLNKTQIPQMPSRSRINYVLVESCGEILLVRVIGGMLGLQCGRERELRAELYQFQVFRADFSEMEWVKMESLDDRMLFLSEGSSISVSAAEAGGRGNCIFFIPRAANAKGFWIEYELDGDGPIKHSIPHYEGEIEATWITPCLN